MTVTTMDISTRRGTNLPLDSRRRDALATYARLAAEDDGLAPQTWCRRTWGLKEYEAKDLLRGNASEAIWERIMKSPHPRHGGWNVALPVLGAVIGKQLHEHLRAEIQVVARAHEELEQHARLAEAAHRRLSIPRPRRPLEDREGPAADRDAGSGSGEVGTEEARRLG